MLLQPRGSPRELVDRAPPRGRESEVKDTLYRIAGTQAPEARQTLAALATELAQSEGASQAARELADLLGARAFTDTAARAETPPPTTLGPAPEVDVAALRGLLDGPHAAIRDRMREFLGEPGRRAYGLQMPQYRALVMDWLRELANTGIGELAYPGVTAKGDLQGFMAAFETLALGDLSLLVKCGVQFGLFGGSILNLGTARHHALLPAVARLELLGCFAMSEVGHGSNVAELETVARYDHDTRELVIHTPSESARKEWIGGAVTSADGQRWCRRDRGGGGAQGCKRCGPIRKPRRDVPGRAAMPTRWGSTASPTGPG